MSTCRSRYTSVFSTRYGICLNDHPEVLLSKIIILCKIIVLTGLLITFFSDNWAVSPISPYTHAGYKNRCSVHLCTSKDVELVWLIDIACILAIIHLITEFISFILMCCHNGKVSNLNIMIEIIIFFSTFVLMGCLILSTICVIIYAHGLPMGYAFSCFIISTVVSIVDWIFSIRRLIASWPIGTVQLHNHSMTPAIHLHRSMSEPLHCTEPLSNSIMIHDTHV